MTDHQIDALFGCAALLLCAIGFASFFISGNIFVVDIFYVPALLVALYGRRSAWARLAFLWLAIAAAIQLSFLGPSNSLG